MELLLILLICAVALFYMIRHLIQHFEKRSSCCQGCHNCPSKKETCEQIEKIDIDEGNGEK
ncbi:FeoB-associated Cys-rich membrane protein [Dehalobacterium formicoaceticum]|uniref:FeoB-associated Cys-rich membrane protein n=1 Tax=Dehalobacterium formicoaceticum TaxID=51515 RepID=A0ABT1Y838_9FIRM|nr:FeoB-associated Cys-rich membrane protein [Dehalobacterium formicoaceticum]MCR6547049.1 FeoB-associated Cys-rich membrane protein [Dehalobacterium formicoaceticum]